MICQMELTIEPALEASTNNERFDSANEATIFQTCWIFYIGCC